MRRFCLCCWLLIGILCTADKADAQSPAYLADEMAPLPAPAWVQMRELPSDNQALKGLRVPEGVRVQVVATEPHVVDPVGMTFADDGALYVLEWREATEQIDTSYEVRYQDGSVATVNRKRKNALDHLKRLTDTDGDGVFDQAELVMDDLEMPSSLLLHDGWMYLPSMGRVLRRQAADATGGHGVNTAKPATENHQWREQEILRGMCGYHHHQASGLTISHDHWLYTTTGDDDNIAEGSDGSRATVLRTGAIFRSRPDGSRLSEFARGFRNPYRNVVFDENYNMFHVDNDQEDGSKFQGVRLMHLLEGADYGWRLELGAKCCRTDFARGAVFGERPGKMPSMRKVGRGAPAGLLVYQGNAFPNFFRGLLIYPDVYRMKVRAYEVERVGSTFRVVSQFTLMEADDGMFRPVQAAVGPDGAIYVLDWRTNSGGAGRSWGDGQHGRVYRLTWSGTSKQPAIAPGPMDAWSQLEESDTPDLLKLLATTKDFELRERAQRHLLAGGIENYAALAKIAQDQSLRMPARASALGAVCRLDWARTAGWIAQQLDDSAMDARRLAAEACGHHFSQTTQPAAESARDEMLAKLLKVAAHDAHPAVRRAAALAVGSIGQHGSEQLRSRLGRELLQVLRSIDRSDVFLYDGVLRAVERCGRPGLLHLATWVRGDDAELRTRATELFLSLRTRAAAEVVDELLAGDTDDYSVTDLTNLLSVHRHILVRPPIGTAGIQRWLTGHPDAPASLQIVALQTMGMVGGGQSKTVTQLALKLMQWPADDIRHAAIQAAGDLRVLDAVPTLHAALTDRNRDLSERQLIIQALALLKAEDWPFSDRGQPAVELILPKLVQQIPHWQEPELVADGLWLIGQVDVAQAQPLALNLLSSTDATVLAAAIDVLSSDREQAISLAQRWLKKQLPPQTRTPIAAALQRHRATDPSGQVAAMLEQLYADGLAISLEPDNVARIRELVKTTGNPARGREVFLRAEQSQCINCHRIEGVGGSVGPDLNKIWQTHTIDKIIESIVAPSREIKEGFDTWTVVTSDGNVYGGLKISDGPPQVILRGANGRDYRIDVADIEEKIPSKRSLMPDATVAELTLTEFVDLVAFLKDEQAQATLPQHAPARQATVRSAD